MSPKDYRLRAQVAKALAHPSRMLIIDVLQEREMTVSELTELVEADQSTVSKHLSVLKNAGIVIDRKQGTSSYYQLLCPCIKGFLDCLEAVVMKNAERYRHLYAGKPRKEKGEK